MTVSPDAQAVYDRLWTGAQAVFAEGRVKTDPYLLDQASDTRRGITVAIRPTADMIASIGVVQAELNDLTPGQHVYAPDELHVTILSLINASASFDLDAVPLERYHAVMSDVFAQAKPLTVHFAGVTASPDSVFVFGHSADDALNVLRDRLRTTLTHAGLGDTLDRRYRITTAHTTILRFRAQPPNLEALAQYLRAARSRDLGAFTAHTVEFTFNDWYMSRDVVRVLARYPLSGG